jgi:hypothetical protein
MIHLKFRKTRTSQSKKKLKEKDYKNHAETSELETKKDSTTNQ